jgi:hypothetical protein
MNKTLRIAAVALAIVIAAALAGCNVITINSERDKAQVVARVNGNEITKGQVLQMSDLYAPYYISVKKTDPAYNTQLKALRDSITEDLIQNELIKSHGKDYGITGLSADDQKKAEDEYQSNMTTAAQTATETLKSQGIANPTDAEIQAQVDQAYAKTGTTREQVRKDIEQGLLLDEIGNAMRGTVKEVTDAEVTDFYNRTLSKQKADYENTPSDFESDYKNKAFITYNPAGYRLIKQIFIKVSDDDVTKIQGLIENKDATLESAKSAALATLMPKVTEVYTKLSQGTSFDDLIKQYNQDTSMDTYPAGYILGDKTDVSANTETTPSEEFYLAAVKTAALKLAKTGDYTTDVVATNFGYHILQYVADITPVGEIPFDTIKDQAKTNALSEKQNTAYNDLLTKWGKEDKIERHLDILNP